ncbi:hypothetical protein [Aureispira anguillae]|uniref:Lipoprotein n=1 Tax=Aureispira anguillae TaxID=2864201 RepID=A0A915YM67_9BACT|nr:hypothetical protein [Aureispira anguillae]BDS15348.1 hypothetical protein AsAng_0061320 [Aureispira anguillae]
MNTFRKVLLLTCLFALPLLVQCQIKNTLTIYSEIEEPFILTVNGEQMSEDYVKRLEFETYNNYMHVTIKFQNPELPDMVNKYIHIASEGKPAATVYKIYKKEKKKKGKMVTLYKLGYISSATKTIPAQTVINNTQKESNGITIKKGNTKVTIGH